MSNLTRSITDRLFIGILSLIFAPGCGFILYERFFRSHDRSEHEDWFLRLFSALCIEGFCAVFLVAILGIVWAVWTPDWIEHRLKHAFGHFVLIVVIVGAVLTVMCFSMLFLS